MENCFLKRVLDFKLIYDCLAEPSSGLVRLDTLVSNWPADLLALSKLPQDCEAFWRRSATSEGFLDWDGFSGGLEKALKADEERLGKRKSFTPTQAEQAAARSPVAQVTAGEIECFLASCQAGSLMKALAKAGRDVHRWQVSIHKQNSAEETPGNNSVLESRSATVAKKSSKQTFCTSLSVAREREELVRGTQVLENTQQWFQSRLAVLSLEEQQRVAGSEQMCAEDLLAEIEGGEDSQLLNHLREINMHLSSLALMADAHHLPSLKKPLVSPKQQQNRHGPYQPIAVVEYPSHKIQPQKPVPHTTESRAVKASKQWIHRSASLPVEYQAKAAALNHTSLPPPAPRRKSHRSSSFNDKNKGALDSWPVRTASSMSTLIQQCTDYPGHMHRPQPSPVPQRPIHHSSSVHSLPGHYPTSRQAYHPSPKNAPPLLISCPPSRAHSMQSLSQAGHQKATDYHKGLSHSTPPIHYNASRSKPGHQLVSEVL